MYSMDVYERLALKLDGLPNGFPRTETGVELKMLRKIFHPEEAEVFIKMTLLPETAAKIAERLGKSIEDMGEFLDRMVKRGEIGTDVVNGERVYFLIPFIVGVYEGQRNVLDKELAELGREYVPIMMKTLGGFTPPIGRVIPVGVNIATEVKIYRSADIRQMIEEAKCFNLKTCICRKGKRLVGDPCKRLTKDKEPVGCLAISKDPNAFTGLGAAILGENISKEKALKVLAEAEEAGCVHVTFNVNLSNWKTLPICNCCDCCCEFLHAMNTSDTPHMYAQDQVAHIDQDICVACGVCKDERCPVGAIAEDKGSYKISSERCIGCGVCTVTCPTNAITLEKKSESVEKPANLMDWYAKRAKSRGIVFPS